MAKRELKSSYEMKDLGKAKLKLGILIHRDPKSGDITTLTQEAYSKQLLERFNIHNCIPRSMPLPTSLVLSTENSSTNLEKINKIKNIPY